MIHWELCKKFKFDMQNLEDETQKLLWNYEIQTDYLISSSRPVLW